MHSSVQRIGLRKAVSLKLGYNDRNDGFNRSAFSSSKWKHSRIHKETKPSHVKPLSKAWINNIY